MSANTERFDANWPHWAPASARHYIAHTEAGMSIRALARASDCHASTILRQVRKFERKRDDPLVDDALRNLSKTVSMRKTRYSKVSGVVPDGETSETQDDADFEVDAVRVLKRLSERGAVLAVARDLDMAVVVRDDGEGTTTRTANVTRKVAQILALREWIACTDPDARVARYYITNAGRTALKNLLAGAENRAFGFVEQSVEIGPDGPIWAKHIEDAHRHVSSSASPKLESPLIGLARRRDRDGDFFLTRELVSAGERLREDFELANLALGSTKRWKKFLSGELEVQPSIQPGGKLDATARVEAAICDLGPGLSDVALRCCCFLDGLETTEKELGWAARSGKIVLRIALQRLRLHYAEMDKGQPNLIG